MYKAHVSFHIGTLSYNTLSWKSANSAEFLFLFFSSIQVEAATYLELIQEGSAKCKTEEVRTNAVFISLISHRSVSTRTVHLSAGSRRRLSTRGLLLEHSAPL